MHIINCQNEEEEYLGTAGTCWVAAVLSREESHHSLTPEHAGECMLHGTWLGREPPLESPRPRGTPVHRAGGALLPGLGFSTEPLSTPGCKVTLITDLLDSSMANVVAEITLRLEPSAHTGPCSSPP